MKVAFAILMALCIPTLPRPSYGGQAASARRAFDAGVAHMTKGEYDRAASQFRRSLRADPSSVGAWINLAICYEHVGDIVKAWKFWSGATQRAEANRDDRVGKARQGARLLESKLAWVEIRVPDDLTSVNVTVDGERLTPTAGDTVIEPVLPGKHSIEIQVPETEKEGGDKASSSAHARGEVHGDVLRGTRTIQPSGLRANSDVLAHPELRRGPRD